MKKRLKLTTKDIAMAAIFLSFIFVFMLVPLSPFGVDLAVIALISVCVAVNVKGFAMGLFTGAAFGLASLLKAFVHPNWTSPVFYNPLVSIVPRILIPITAYFTFRFVKKLLRKRPNEVSTLAASTASTIVGVCTNTLLVLGMWAAFYLGDSFTDPVSGTSTTVTWALFAGIISSNFIIELAICTVLTPPICVALRLALRIDKRGRRDVDLVGAPVSAERVSDTQEAPTDALSESVAEEQSDAREESGETPEEKNE